LKPDVPQFYLNRAYCNVGLQNVEAARRDAILAKQMGLQIDPPFAQSLGLQ
jgi:hypothetical protein